MYTYVDAQEGVEYIDSIGNVSVYPHPVGDEFSLLTPSDKSLEFQQVKMYNTLLQEVFQCTDPPRQINVKFLASGLYSVVLKTNKGTVLCKFVKD